MSARLPTWRRIARIVAALVLCIGAAALWWWYRDRTHSRVFRMGYQSSPPGQLLDAENRPIGPVPEAVREAASRTGIRIEWVFAPEGPDKAFAAARVDLWPLIIRRPGREGRIYITDPYLRLTYWIVSREGFAMPKNWSGMRVARGTAGVSPAWVGRYMAGATSTLMPTQVAAMEAACRGDVDVAVVAEGIGDGLLMSRPPGCTNQRLVLSTLEQSVLWLGLGANPHDRAAVQAADALREAAGAMTRDGRFATITLNWDLVTTGQASTVYEYTESQRTGRLLGILAAALAFGALCLVIQQIRLSKARAAAVAASHAKSVFLANMSHEIRTPMNGVLGMAELMLRTPLSGDQRDYAETIRQSGQALMELINGILDLAKVEAGKMQLSAEPFDPAGLLHDVARLFRARAVEKGLDLRVETPAAGPQAVGDALRIRQILANLAGNAVKFTERGSVVLRLAAMPEPSSTISLRYEVEDTGVGIAPDDLARVFDVFTQAHNDRAGKFGGAGLGLAISKKLAGLMGGKMTVSSQPGSGSVFAFEIALPSAAVSNSVPSQTAAVSEERAFGARVLVVEDNAVNQKLIGIMLSRLGCSSRIAASGPEALDLVAREPFDLVLMDWQMPGMDGLETARRMKELWRDGAAVPIVAVTASAMQGDREACLAAGMSDYLAKPIDLDRLAKVVERWGSGKMKA